STYIGGSSTDAGHGIAVDTVGNTYVTGPTSSSNFPITPGANDTTSNGGWDGFVLKLNSTGTAFIYSTYIGGSSSDGGSDIAVDTAGNAYVTGYTKSSDFPNTTGANDTTYNGGYDVFVLKLNPTGATLLYSTFIGGTTGGDEQGNGIAVDATGNAYVTGYTFLLDFPITSNANDTTHNGNQDGFVLKLNPTGASLLYSTFIGGSNGDWGYGIAVDTAGNIYVTGTTESSDFPITPGAFNDSITGVFVLKLNPTGASLLYSTFIGGGIGNDISVDTDDNAYVTGYTATSNFPTTPDANDTTYNGDPTDGFMFKLNPTGATLLYSTYIGGSSRDEGYGIAVDTAGNTYVTGYTESSDFTITPNANDTTHNGNYDGFVFKFGFYTLPSVVDLKISDIMVFRTNSIYLYSNATDFEDLEQNLTPHLEFRDPNEQVWNNTFFSNPQYYNSRWEVNFTPPKNATLGLYDFRVRFNDTFPKLSNWFYLNDSLMVLNNVPLVENLFLSNNTAILGDTISIWLNGSDIEELEENLTVALEYQDPSETSWDKTDLSTPTYNNGRWEYSFNMPFDALFGYYDFRARCNDSDGNYSEWVYLNDSLLVYNTGPKVIDAKLSEISIYRTESVYLFINGSDYETPEGMLSFYVQFKPQSEDEWTNLTGNYLNNTWEVGFVTKKESMIGMYDFRTKFEDNETLSTGWVYLNDSLKILNNPPIISEDLDDITIGIQPLIIDLTLYESDIEDTDVNLTWSIEPQTYTYIESATIIDTINDTIKIVPKENTTGTEDIELTLTDKDSGTAIKSDITINIDSTISEFTPKVTLLSPPDKTTINTLTPTLKW
ncbi:MAG: SBBP repeat-containing protein, partial [Thermoplasmata archaeon]|nr:SBBP repeat-containing protein [Thermoplasmata archaeon]